MKALVTDAHLREVVAGIRGLGRGGIPVVALASGPSAAGVWSRYVVSRSFVPESAVHSHDLPDTIAAIARRRRPIVLYPGAEETLNALVEATGPPPAVRLPYGCLDALRLLRDKKRLAELANEAGLAVPATVTSGYASDLPLRHVDYPCVVKPIRSGSALSTTRVVHSAGDLERVLEPLPPTEPLLVQERYAGSLMAVALVIDASGHLLARFQQESHGVWPPEAGVSSTAVSVAPDERLIGRAAEVLRVAGYSGLAQLQFIRGERGPLLIDVNPRFYGSLPLALASGVNLPAIWHGSVAFGERSRVGDYRVGVTYRWLRADVAAAIQGSPRTVLRLAPRPRVGAVWAPDDPLPSLVSTAGTLARAMQRRLPSRSGRRGA